MRRFEMTIVVAAVVASLPLASRADTLTSEGRIAAGGAEAIGFVAWRVSPADGAITEVRSPRTGLTDRGIEALDVVPLWIRGDLEDLFMRLLPMDQVFIADTILGLDDPRLIDEVAYTFAYLAPEQYDTSRIYLDIVEENARWIYEVDPYLDYVALVEEGTPGVDEDWYTTAEYVVLREGLETTFRLPREVYYEYVVHPVLQDEPLLRIDPTNGSRSSSGFHWRTYFWSDDALRTYERHFFLDNPVRIEDADLSAYDFGGPAAGTVLTGPDRSYSTVIRDSSAGDPVLLEFVGQGGGCCSNDVPNPNGHVFVTTIALERAAAAGHDGLLAQLLAAGPANMALRSNMLGSSSFTDTVEMRILVLRDQVPYGLSSDPVEDGLVALDIAPVDVIGSAGFSSLALITTDPPYMPADYSKIVVVSDQPVEVYDVLRDRADDIGEYVRRGGTFEFHGDSSVDWTDHAMPFGIDAEPLDGSHEVTGLEIKGYPFMQDVIGGASYLWDGERVNLPGERAFDTGEGAIARLGWWIANNLPWNVQEMTVHKRTSSCERSVEPVRIIYNHYGNCGELQDVFGAALRTALIPGALVGTTLDDHVWNEFFDDDEYHPLQVSWSGSTTHIDNWGVAYDADTGGSKTIKAMISYRGDGFVRNLLGRYPVTEDGDGHIDGDYSRYVTLRPLVTDADGVPVDGARVVVFSHHLYDGGGWYIGTWGVTGPDGTVDITVGEGEDYAVRIEGPLGTIPATGSRVYWVRDTETVAGALIERTFAYDGEAGHPLARMPSWDVTALGGPDEPGVAAMHLALDVRAGRELTYGENYFFSRTWREPVGEAVVDVLLLDADNYALLEAGEPFEAFRVEEGVEEVALEVPLDPEGQDLYVVAANAGRVVNSKELSVDLSTFWPEPEPEPDDAYPEATDGATDGDAGDEDVGAGGGCGCAIVS